MKLALGIVAAWLLGSVVASAQSVDAERLQAMRKAAASLEYLAAWKDNAGERVLPSSPEVGELLAVVCNAREAESLGHPRVDQFEDIRLYTRHVTTVLTVFTSRGIDPRDSLLAPELEPCIDADLWLSRASLHLLKRLLSESPSASQDAKTLAGLRKMQISSVFQLRLMLRLFQLRGVVQPAWCEARMRPLHALAETVAKDVPPEHRGNLRAEVRAAEACSPAAKPGLQLIYDKLAP